MEQSTSSLQVPIAAPAADDSARQPGLPHRFSTVSAAEKADVLMHYLEENKARDVLALDVSGFSQCMDVVMVLTASSPRHARSLADGLLKQCAQHNYEFLRMEGYQAAQWILVDINDVVVHIFQQDMRDLFQIEALWKQAPLIRGDMPR